MYFHFTCRGNFSNLLLLSVQPVQLSNNKKKSQLNIKKDKNPSSSLPHQNYLAMSGADNPPVGRDHLEYLELQRAQAAAIAATADLNMSDMVATAAAASSPNYNSNDFTSTFSALPPRSAMNKLIMNYLVTGETT